MGILKNAGQVATLYLQGPDSIKICHLTSKGNPIVELRRSYDRLISTMGFPILVRRHLHIESGPRSRTSFTVYSCPPRVAGTVVTIGHLIASGVVLTGIAGALQDV